MRLCSIILGLFLLGFLVINSSGISKGPYGLAASGDSSLLQVSLFGLFKPQALHIRTPGKTMILEDLVSGQKRTAAAARLTAHAQGIRVWFDPGSSEKKQESIIFNQTVKISSPGGLELSPDPQKLPFRGYSGTLRISRNPQGFLQILEEVTREDYTAGVVAAEMKNVNAPEAQKALAVVARTFALKNKGRHGKDGFGLCDTTHCQLYQGAPFLHSGALEAVKATQGEMLYYQNNLAWVYYHSTCGGRTADAGDFPHDPQALGYKSIDDQELCRTSPHASWQYSLTLEKIQRALVKEQLWPAGETLRKITIARQGTSGRAAVIALRGNSPQEIDAWDFRNAVCRTYGWSTVKSTLFEIEKKGENIIFRGRGLGHGLGLCQYGAMEMAKRGFNYREILRHYYPEFSLQGGKAARRQGGKVIGRGVLPYAPFMSDSKDISSPLGGEDKGGGEIYSPSPSPSPQGRGIKYRGFLPYNPVAEAAVGATGPAKTASPLQHAQSEHFILNYPSAGEENQILPHLEKAYHTIKSRYGYTPSSLVKATFYPSTADYCRATGQPWWLGSATTVEGMHFQPFSVLQQRGGVSTYLMHEYTHWMVQDISKGRSPHWLNEGLALLESGEGAILEKEMNKGRGGVTPAIQEIEEGLRSSKDKETLRQNYYWAYKFTRCLEVRFGRGKILKFIGLLGQGIKEAEAGKRVFGEPLEKTEREICQ